MKSALFSNLGQEENNLVKAQAVVNAVHRSKNSYNYVVLVTYEHKFNLSCGGLIKTKWVWKTETRHRHETKFNQKKFDDDLAQAQLLFNEAERAIKNETQSNNYFDVAEVVTQKINDIKQAFLIALNNGDLELINVLIFAKPEELNPKYCASLVDNDHNENISSILSQLLMQASNEAMDYSQQAIGKDGYMI